MFQNNIIRIVSQFYVCVGIYVLYHDSEGPFEN